MTIYKEKFTYSDLKNGVFEPLNDVIVSGTVVININTIEWLLIDQDTERTRLLGKGCYRGIYFPNEFDGEITLTYGSYDSTRNELDEDRLETPSQTLSYNKLVNKSTVIDDGEREDIDFYRAKSVDPLLSRYLLLQQFSGKRMVSKYVIARAIDDYFENHYEKVSINLTAGKVEPDIPWLRMNTGTGSRLEIDDQTLVMQMNGVVSKLSPIDPYLTDQCSEVISNINGLFPEDEMYGLVYEINRLLSTRSSDNRALLNKDFNIDNDTLTISASERSYAINYSKDVQTSIDEANVALEALQGIYGNQERSDEYNELINLIDTRLSNMASHFSFRMDKYNGNSITSNGNTLTFLGEKDNEMVNDLIENSSEFLIPQSYESSILQGRAFKEIKSSRNESTLLNRSASSIDEMLNYLS